MTTPHRPSEAIDNASTRVFLAVLEIASRQDFGITVREVSESTGYVVGYTHRCLKILREHGLVSWTEGQARTIRPRAMVVN